MRRLNSYPVRPLTPDERALVAEWFASAGDVVSAYVSNRRGDDPAIYHRVVISTLPDGSPSHLIQALLGRDLWLMFSLGPRTKIQRFRTLGAALNSIRSVLVNAERAGSGRRQAALK
jgi:hypothetical protein